jgi:hypothetical protein
LIFANKGFLFSEVAIKSIPNFCSLQTNPNIVTASLCSTWTDDYKKYSDQASRKSLYFPYTLSPSLFLLIFYSSESFWAHIANNWAALKAQMAAFRTAVEAATQV